MKTGTKSIWHTPAQALFLFCFVLVSFLFFSVILFLYIVFFQQAYWDTIHPFKGHDSMYLNIFAKFCSHDHYLILEFCQLKRELMSISSHVPLAPPQFQPEAVVIYFLCFKCMNEAAANLNLQARHKYPLGLVKAFVLPSQNIYSSAEDSLQNIYCYLVHFISVSWCSEKK